MSFKLYNGIKFNAATFDELNGQLTAMKKIVGPIYTEKVLNHIGKIMALSYDRAAWLNLDFNSDAAEATCKRIRELLYPEEITAHIVLFEGSFYGAFNVPRTICDNIEEMVPHEPYGYWDNTDPDETCTEEEWAERERIWTTVFEGYYRLSDIGWNITLGTIPPEYMFNLPNFETRVLELCNSLKDESEEMKALVSLKLDANLTLSALYK